MPNKPISELGGEIFLVAELQDFPLDSFTLSFWTKEPTRLFYGNYDTGSSYEDTETFLDIQVSSRNIQFNFVVANQRFNIDTYPLFDGNQSHHIAAAFHQTAQGYTISCYVNAVLLGSKTVQLLNGNNRPMRLLSMGPLYLGNAAPDVSQDGRFGDLREARGCMSELHIYRKTLSAHAINVDALGEIPDSSNLFMNLPLDELHYDRRRGIWLNTVQPDCPAKEKIRTDNHPVIVFERSFSQFPTSDRSVAFWIRCRQQERGVLISYGDVSTSDAPNDGGSEWVLQDPSSLRLGSISFGLDLGTGSWNHVVLVEDATAGTTCCYLNGQPGPNSPVNYVIDGVIANQPFILGAQQANDAEGTVFTGDLVELRFWSRPLSADEIAGFARGVVPDSNDPYLMYYNSREATGVQEILSGNKPMYFPLLNQQVTYSLLSASGAMHALQICPGKGGMRTLPYSGIDGIELSLECWTRSTADGYLCVGRTGTMADNSVIFSLARASGAIDLLIYNTNTTQPDRFTLKQGLTDLSDWHHIAITFSGMSINAYLDGQEVLSETMPDPSILPSLNQLYLEFGGTEAEESSMEGELAEIRLWNRALPLGEIRHRMYRFLMGSEFGLIGRWAFENSLGRDTSSEKRHAFPVDQPEFNRLSGIDLEPLDSPYLVAQVSLIEDYHFDEGQITERNAYRVMVTAYNESDRPMTGIDLSVSVQAEPNNPFQAVDLLIDESKKTEAKAIAIGESQALTTNSRGSISFALAAEDLIAPVLRITAPFMSADHALLIFPDRQAHHQLAQVTETDLLHKKVVMEAGGEPVPMVSEEQRESAPHVAQAIRHLMGVATEKNPQSNTPVERPVQDRLREVVTPPDKRMYENAKVSPWSYDSQSDVIAGYAVGAGQNSISRSLSVNQMPSWRFEKTGSNNFTVRATSPGHRTRYFALTDNLRYADKFTRLLLTSVDGRKRGVVPTPYADLLAAIDQESRERSQFDLFTLIKEAAGFVVHTVEQVYESVKETIRVAVIYITDAANKVTAFAIHTVQHAVEAVKGVLAQVGATLEGAINFVKVLFDWEDILETQEFTENLLKSVMTSARANLTDTKTKTLAWVERAKGETHDWLENLKSNTNQHKSSIREDSVPVQRSSIKGSYIQHMIASHGQHASLDGDEGRALDPGQSDQQLDRIHRDNPSQVDHINGSLSNLHLFSGTDFSREVILDRLIDLFETIASSLFDLMAAGIEWFFDQLARLLEELDKMLAYRVDIPLLTRLYEQVITKKKDGVYSQLTLYSLSALLGAIPTTLTYKLATGSERGPFHGEKLSSYRNVLVSHQQPISPEQAERERQLAIQQKASLGLGGCFLSFIAISGIFNTILSGNKRPSLVLKRVAFAFNGVFQLTQFPLGSTFALKANPDPRAAETEVVIWVAQFFPVVLEGIAASDKLDGNSTALDTFSGVAMTVFGGLHAALFITVFALEMADPHSDKLDSKRKFVANLASCVPELTALMNDPPAEALISILSFTAWESLSLIRYANEVKNHQNFLAR
ncbi:LamG-like jellyroll fold domain-containing protein [Cyclobacterium xiamenense]|uniref:LamG domain-containing protein n=1 Tax=Cyclobacterium xiamenense TaxID=1297121 RepID=UPI0035D11777